jgi:hypothetical protein
MRPVSRKNRSAALSGGSVSIFGRQFSIASSEPQFRHLNIVLEGHNEVSVYDRSKAFD